MSKLTKSQLVEALQCPRRLWLTANLPVVLNSTIQDRLEAGRSIGEAAHRLFPGGVMVSSRGHHAVDETAALMRDASTTAIFEGAFVHDDVTVRVDVLERIKDDAWRLCEVKSSTKVKGHHITDVALQYWVLRGSGVPVKETEVIHVDSRYYRGKDGVDWPAYFKRAPVPDAVNLEDIDHMIASSKAVLAMDEAPEVPPGSHCRRPFMCPHQSRCTALLPPSWHVQQAKVRADLRLQWMESAERGNPWVSPTLKADLLPIRGPVLYLDFEAVVPAVPLFPGTKPYEAIPFQWSIHRSDKDGAVHHREFLANSDDPRRATAESLVETLQEWPDERIVVYSSYEKTTIKRLASLFPDLRGELMALLPRLYDLLPVVRQGYYHPAFLASFSLKRVAPVLAPHLSYEDLEGPADGEGASHAYLKLLGDSCSPLEASALRRQLLAYCERDTAVLMAVHSALDRASDNTQ